MAKGGGTTRGGGASNPRGTGGNIIERAWGGASGTANIANQIRSTFGTFRHYELSDERGRDSYTITRSTYGGTRYALRKISGPFSSDILSSHSTLEAAIDAAKKRRLIPKGNKGIPSSIGT